MGCPYADKDIELDVSTIQNILYGVVSDWNDTSIQVQNPTITLPGEPIRIVQNKYMDPVVESVLNKQFKTYLGESGLVGGELVDGEIKVESENELLSAIAALPYSFAYTFQNQVFSSLISLIKVSFGDLSS